MKTNSTCKFLRRLLILLVGMLGFAVSGAGQVTITKQQGASNISSVSNCGTKYYASFTTDQYTGPCISIKINNADCTYNCSGKLGNTTFKKIADGRYGDYSCAVGSVFTAYVIVDTEVGNESVLFTTADPTSLCGATVSSANVVEDFGCVGTTLHAGSNATGGTPTYQWKKDGENIPGAIYDSYEVPDNSIYAGSYTVEVCASGGSPCVTSSNSATISGSPTISVSPETLTFTKEPGQANASSIVTISTACVDLEDVTVNCADANYTITDHHNGTYTITFKSEDLDDEGDVGNYNTTVTFDDGVGGAAPCVLTLNGRIASCVGQNIASFDFLTNKIGSTVGGVTMSTSLTFDSGEWGDAGTYCYNEDASLHFSNKQFPLTGNDGKCFQLFGKNTTFSNTDILNFTGIPTTGVYVISFTMGNLGNYTNNDNICTSNVMLNGTSIGSVPYRETTTLSGIVTESSSAAISLTTSTGSTSSSNLFFIDNVSISKVCPPEIVMNVPSNECDASASFSATATAGTGAIASYTWYVNGDVEATHTSSSTTDTFEPGRTLSNNSIVRVVVTDEYGVTAEATYTTNCGPDVNDIKTPDRICIGGDLVMDVPTVTPKAGTSIESQGWEVADSPTSNDWTPLASLNGLSASYNNKYIRYYAIDNTDKKGKSNAVQITMFKVPEVGTISIDDICVGGTFILPSTGSTVYADADDDGDTESTTIWQYSTASNFSSVNTLTDATQFNSNGTYYIRYGVTDECNITTYSETSADVNVRSITPSYDTYLRVAGMTGVVVGTSTTTSTCAGELHYSIIDGNGSNYFAIDELTGEITVVNSAPARSYPMTVSITDGTITRTVDITVTLTATPTLTVDGCLPSEVYVYTNQPFANTFSVGSGYVNGDIELSLAGSAATAFTLSQTSVTKNTVQDVTATLATPFTSAGPRTLTFTAHDSYGSSEVADVECSTTINVVGLSIRDYVDAQTSCNSTANMLRVVATGEDATHLPLTYQWYKDNVAIPGATSSSYTPTKAGSGNGAYHCVVSANGNVVHTTDKANISFVDGVPELTFDDSVEIPSEIFCSQEIGAVMKVTFDGNDVTDDYDRFWWINNHSKAMEGITETGVHTYSFNCDGSQYTATIGAYIRDNASGCVVTITKDVTVNPMGNVYYYCGPDGDGSDVTSASNWCTVENGNPASCTHPLVDGENKFYEPGSQYIINKDNVVLKSGQEWKVAGTGSKITIGDGNWSKDNFTSVGNDWNRFTNNAPWGVPNGNYAESIGTFTGQSMQGQMTKIAEHDYRDYAKKFTISGTLTTYEDVNVDVNNGSSVNVTTTDGNFSFGDMAKDEITHADGNANGYYNIVVKPGSSVTYSGNGAKKIRSGDYSQLYIQDVATDNLGDICFETSANVTVAQVLKNTTSVSLDNINPNGSTVEYVGTVNQEVAPLKYWNLRTESASNKTLIGDIEVANSLYIGAGSTLVAGNVIGSDTCDITVSGGGEHAVEMVGHFKPGVSTFTYASGSETTVEAMNYFNLNLGSNDRTLSSRNVIGIAGSLITDGGSPTYTVEGSTVEFNGGVKQHIPEFTFYNLTINDTAMRANTGSSLNPEFFLEMDGNVEVQNNIILTEGVLRINAPAKANEEDPDPDPYVLMLSNPASSAIGQGYYTSAQRACYINGAITHVLPKNLNESSTIYYFPVGDDMEYMPLMLNNISTTESSSSDNPLVTVGVEYEGVDGKLAEDNSNVKTGDAWHVSGDGYTSGSVGVSLSGGLGSNELGAINALAYGRERTSENFAFEDIYGSVSDGTVLFSQTRAEGYYALIHRTITNKTYYYDCSGDITNISSWRTKDGSGNFNGYATSFDETDAKWVIECGTTINGPLTINGSNSTVEISIPKGQQLIISDTVDFITATVKKGTVNVASDGMLTVDYGFQMDDIADDSDNRGNYTNRTSLINNGHVNLYLSNIVLTNSYIENNGYLYTENVNWDLSSPGLSQEPGNLLEGAAVLNDDGNVYHHTQFINNSKIEMINANIYVTDAGNGSGMVHVRNSSNAVWLVDNTNKSGASFVNFEGIEFAHSDYGRDIAFVDFQCNSTFVVKHADMTMKYKGNINNTGLNCPAWIGGDITVEDGNMTVGRGNQGGGTFTLEQTCGNIYLKDTDNSGDGIFSCYGTGGYTVNIAGTLYAMGVTVSSGASGSSFNVKDDGTVFIGNIGAQMPTYTWQFTINVEDGGTLYYCGNRTAGADNVGSNNGQLYYAGNYYSGTNPIAENDFTNSGKYDQLYASEEQCMAAYREGLPNTDPAHLMPVELTMLYGVCIEDNQVELRWQTASETNCSYFAILRSFDGIHFVEIDYISGAGTTTETHNYVYYDTDDNDGIVYYKLRQVDYDDNFTDSKVIAVQTCGKNAHFSIGSEEIEIFFRNPQANYVVITSVTGQIFYSKKFTNVEEARIAVPQRKGIYIISVIDNKQITSEKFIR